MFCRDKSIVFIYYIFFKDNSLVRQLAIKDRQLILAAKCGNVLLEQKDELERQIENLNRDYQQQIDVPY
jgi:uncharacterized protein YkvS